MSRSLWKGPIISLNLIKKVLLQKEIKDINKKKTYKIFLRNNNILPCYVQNKFLIHNGKSFVNLVVTDGMIGHKFGEFSFTRLMKSKQKEKKIMVLSKKKNVSNTKK